MEELITTHWIAIYLIAIYLIVGLALSLACSHTMTAKMDRRWGWGLVTLITIFWGLMVPVAIWKMSKGK